MAPELFRQSGHHARALQGYQQALTAYQSELTRLDELQRRVATQPLLSRSGVPIDEDIEALFQRFDSPYLIGLFSDGRFRRAYRDYQELYELAHYVDTDVNDLGAYSAGLDARRDRYARRSWALLERYRGTDYSAFLRRVREYRRELAEVEKSDDAMRLMTTAEKSLLEKLDRTEAAIQRVSPYMVEFGSVLEKFRLLRGLKFWQVINEFDDRLKMLKDMLDEAEQRIGRLKERGETFVQRRKEAKAQLQEQAARLRDLSQRYQAVAARPQQLLTRYESYLKGRLLATIERQRRDVTERLARAHFAIAQLNDHLRPKVAVQ